MKKVKFITIEQLLETITNKEKFKLVEVLDKDAYKNGHIPGAINIPIDYLKDAASKHLNKTDTIVVYCRGYTCHASTNASIILMDMGYKKVLDFKGGKELWVDAGFELEK